MMKKKTFDIADSNIANLGSELEKNVKKASAEGEPAWNNAGKKEGMQIWRIEKFKVKAWPQNQYGQFYSGDSYICLNTYKDKENPLKLQFDLHFWLGCSTSQDEAGTAAYKTVELDTLLGDVPVQHREIEAHESGLFLSYFPDGIRIMEGGVESGFNHVEPTSYRARLMHLKGRKNVRIVEVPLDASSLNAGDVFVLDNGLTLYQWNGSGASIKEKTRAAQLCRTLDDERKGQPEVVVVEQNDKDIPAAFWDLLGGIKAIAGDQGGDEDWEKKQEKILFQLSDAGGKLEFIKIAEGPRVTTDKLDSKDAFILDAGVEIFVWVGKLASKNESTQALPHAMKYMRDNNRPNWLPVTRIVEGGENAFFKSMFSSMGATGGIKRPTPTAVAGVSTGAGTGCYLTYTDSSNGSMILNWSKSAVDGALAYFEPTKTIPAHKFKTNGGREELTRNVDNTPKNGFQAWCNYLKLAKSNRAAVTLYSADISLCVLDDANKLIAVTPGSPFTLHDLNTPAVGAWPSKNPLFEGSLSTGRDHFLNTCQGVGAALVLPKN